MPGASPNFFFFFRTKYWTTRDGGGAVWWVREILATEEPLRRDRAAARGCCGRNHRPPALGPEGPRLAARWTRLSALNSHQHHIRNTT